MFEGTFGCCKRFFVFFFLLECMFDARECDLNALSVERFQSV